MLSVFEICPGRTFLIQNHGLEAYLRNYSIKAHGFVLHKETVNP